MAADKNIHLCVRVPKALRRRFDRVALAKCKSPSEAAREALLAYVELRERELALQEVRA